LSPPSSLIRPNQVRASALRSSSCPVDSTNASTREPAFLPFSATSEYHCSGSSSRSPACVASCARQAERRVAEHSQLPAPTLRLRRGRGHRAEARGMWERASRIVEQPELQERHHEAPDPARQGEHRAPETARPPRTTIEPAVRCAGHGDDDRSRHVASDRIDPGIQTPARVKLSITAGPVSGRSLSRRRSGATGHVTRHRSGAHRSTQVFEHRGAPSPLHVPGRRNARGMAPSLSVACATKGPAATHFGNERFRPRGRSEGRSERRTRHAPCPSEDERGRVLVHR
jgi:hypothetical protein